MSGDAVGGGQGEEVGVVEVDVEIAAVVGALLDVLDGAIGCVVVDESDRGGAVPGGGRELVGGHQEAAVAADGDDVTAVGRECAPQGGREAPSQGDVVR